jgi:hypothetical protein
MKLLLCVISICMLPPLSFADTDTDAGAKSMKMDDAVIPNANNFAIAFSRANADKFTNEIKEVKGLTIGTAITVTTDPNYPESISIISKIAYDSDKSEMIIKGYQPNNIIFYSESCKFKGSSFVGQNSFGAKTVVRKKTCDRFIAHDPDIDDINFDDSPEIKIRMSPSQYRSISKNGVRAEIDFIIDQPKEGTVVRFAEAWNDATINHPIEAHLNNWWLNGHVREVRWFLPGEKKPVKVWMRG